ncbi:MAG: single-stranded-DNA-specific exonuclease RecJ [Leptospiraceae bacterium]|nr:single-stranded-DNA-specific exonuclease RecJ [Leptospiraceae bacterium]MCP5512268.1 single-stranded-DNA-specific exonuclease RecJ [Leptospiraceae bacterium]
MKFQHGQNYETLSVGSSPKLSNLQNFLLEKYFTGSNPDEYLSDDFKFTHSPFLLPDLESSIRVIRKHLDKKNHILLYGDRDTDGVSSVSILGIYLREIVKRKGGTLSIRTSSQNDDYGLCDTVNKNILSISPDLLITMDFGTSNYQEINYLAEKGIEIIVLDHHEIPIEIPNCQLVNPKREDSKYPEKRICTSVLAIKLIQALDCVEEHLREESQKDGLLFSESMEINFGKIDPLEIYNRSEAHRKKIRSYMDLAAIGTVADMMPLQGENRTIVKIGLQTLNEQFKSIPPERPGLYLLMKKMNLSPHRILSKDLGWNIGPVLNSAGRMGKTEMSLKLLLSENRTEAEKLADELIHINKERRERTKRNMFRVEKYFERKPERTQKEIIYCYEPDMEPGVSGIVASRLVEKYKKPVVFVTPDHGKARGSVRSYGSENVVVLLQNVSELLEHFGGHPEAGGFSISPNNLPLLESRLEEKAPAWLEDVSKVEIETESILSFLPSSLTDKVFEEILILEPFGQGNPAPLLSLRNVRVYQIKPMGDGSHLRFSMEGVSNKIRGIVWNSATEFHNLLSEKTEVQLFGYLEENYFNGTNSLQFVVSYFS